MAPRCILYLPIEGVLVPEGEMPHRAAQVDAACLCELPHVYRLAEALESEQHVVVLNSAAVARFGFRRVFDMFPYALQRRVIGATVPGNRLHACRHCAVHTGRSVWLEQDVRRRAPTHFIVLESDARYVPVALRDNAVIVSRGLWNASSNEWMSLGAAFTDSMRAAVDVRS